MTTTHKKIPLSLEEVTSAWLTQALRRSGRLGEKESADIIDIRPLSAGTAYSTLMYRMTIAAPRLPGTAILKLAVNGPARPILDGIDAYAREVAFYRDLGGELPVRIPHSYVAELDANTKDMVLVMDFSGSMNDDSTYFAFTKLGKTAVEANMTDIFNAINPNVGTLPMTPR